VSITWYTWLEQGRVVTVSKEVIHSVAKALQLSSEEHLHLLRLANYGEEGDPYANAEEMMQAVYPVEHAAEALLLLEGKNTVGKLVLQM